MDKPKKPKQPSLEKQYQQERRNAKQRIARLRKTGIDISDDILPPIPKTITESSISRLKRLSSKKIIQKAQKQTPPTAQITTHTSKPITPKLPKTGAQKPQKAIKQTTQKQKPQKPIPEHKKDEYLNEPDFSIPTDDIPTQDSNLNLDIVNFVTDYLADFDASVLRSEYLQKKNTANHITLTTKWEQVLMDEGEYEVAYRLEGKAKELHDLMQPLLYGSDTADVDAININHFAEIITGHKLNQRESDELAEIQYNANMYAFGGL